LTKVTPLREHHKVGLYIHNVYIQGVPKNGPTFFVRTSSNSTKFDNFWQTNSQDDRIM